MDDQGQAGHVSPFERIRHTTEDGEEYWSARELATVLGYRRWEQFPGVVAKAQEACANSGQAVSDHFRDVSKMVTLGSGAQRAVQDWHLSRYACYLVVQNADPDKEVVALGQTYFAVQTRRAELADELAGLTEAQQRLRLREEMKTRNLELAATASVAGIVTARDFAIFQDSGYRGLYAGETARDIGVRKGLKSGQKILDWMGSEELAANWFRATQAEAKIRRESITSKAEANQTHHDVGQEVRETIRRLGGTMPEDLPTPAESIQQVRRREQQRLMHERQPALFPESAEEESEDGDTGR